MTMAKSLRLENRDKISIIVSGQKIIRSQVALGADCVGK